MNQSRFERRPAKPTLHPRRVVGGIRLQARGLTAGPMGPTVVTVRPEADAEKRKKKTTGAETAESTSAPSPGPDAAPAPPTAAPTGATQPTGWSWASARWVRLAEDFAPGDQLAEGLEYARAGQTRALETKPGLVTAKVQGRLPTAYRVAIRLPSFTPEQWSQVTAAMTGQARYAASLLGGELPSNIEDLFIPLGLRLFPSSPADLSCSCDCDVFRGRGGTDGGAGGTAPTATPWCKHVCCVMYLLAERLGQQALLLFALRGLPETDLIEHLRQQRALAGLQRAGGAPAPVYSPHIPGLELTHAPLDSAAGHFWTADEPDALDSLDIPIGPPEVTHPLLRRLGPSPFQGAKFPLVGLLATCYDVISAAAIQGEVEVALAAGDTNS